MNNKEQIQARIIVQGAKLGLSSNVIVNLLKKLKVSYRRFKMLQDIRYARDLVNIIKSKS